MDRTGAVACWSLCLPRDESHDIELNKVLVESSGSDSTSEEVTPEPMRPAKPTWRTRQAFDPNVHLKLDATGLHPNHQAIGNSLQSEEDIARLLNYAREFVNSAPMFCPPDFDAATHMQQQVDGSWAPNLDAIRGDDSLTVPQKIDVFRWARIYRPGTRTDPAHVRQIAATAGLSTGAVVAITGVAGAMIYLLNQINFGNCDYRPLNANATEALLHSVQEEFPNATLENPYDWFPSIPANLSESIYLDRQGNLLERVCRSAAQTLDPVLALMVVFSVLAMQMLLQG